MILNPSTPVKFKSYSSKEVSNLYGISKYILRQWLAPYQHEIGERIGLYYSHKQIALIFEKLGIPDY
ncbi:MAG: hypothetical protein ACHQRM_14370 [Bacteroidia bacterium]